MSRQNKRDRGSVMLEFSAVLPVMLGMIVGLVEISSAVNQYMTVSHIAYEATRYASSKAGLATTQYNNGNAKPPANTAAWDIHARIGSLFNSYGYEDSFTFSTARRQPEGSVDHSLVEIEVSVPVRPVFFDTFSNLQLRVRVTGPYLYLSS